MAKLKWRPDHPLADKDGWVNTDTLKEYYYSFEESKSAIIGNQQIRVGTISDHMDPTRHMANGKTYDSKSQFRRATKEAGCIEVGNEVKTLMTPRKRVELSRSQRIDNIKHAIYKIQNNIRD